VTLNVDFTDAGSSDTHLADVDWDNDGTYETVDPFVTDGNIVHTYSTAGSHTAVVRVTGGCPDRGGIRAVLQ
jgi:PKD repeat protein